MNEAEDRGVESEPRNGNRVLAGVTVDGVPEHRVAEVRQMHAHLVGAAGAKSGLNECRATQSQKRIKLCPGWSAAAFGAHRDPAGAGAGAANVALDVGQFGKVAVDDRQIAALHAVNAKLRLEMLDGAVRKSEHHDS